MDYVATIKWLNFINPWENTALWSDYGILCRTLIFENRILHCFVLDSEIFQQDLLITQKNNCHANNNSSQIHRRARVANNHILFYVNTQPEHKSSKPSGKSKNISFYREP